MRLVNKDKDKNFMNKILLTKLVKQVFLGTHTDKRIYLSRLTVIKLKKLIGKEHDFSLPYTQVNPMKGISFAMQKRKNLNLYIKDPIIHGLIRHFVYLHTISTKNLIPHLGREHFISTNERRQGLNVRDAIFSHILHLQHGRSNDLKRKIYHSHDTSYLWQIITSLIFSTSLYKDISILSNLKSHARNNYNKEKGFQSGLLKISRKIVQTNQDKKRNQNEYIPISQPLILNANSNNHIYRRGIYKNEVQDPNIHLDTRKTISIDDFLFDSTKVNKYLPNAIYQIVYNLSKWHIKLYKKHSHSPTTQDAARVNDSLINQNQRYEIYFKSRGAKSMSKLKTGQWMIGSIIGKDTYKWKKFHLVNEDIVATHRLQRALQFQTYLNQKNTIKRFSNFKYKILQNLFTHTYLLPGQFSSIRSASITNKRKLESFKQKNKLRRLNKDLSIYKKYEIFNIDKIHHFVYTSLTESQTSSCPWNHSIDFMQISKHGVKKPKILSMNHLDLNTYFPHTQKDLLAQYVDIHLLRGFLKFDIQSKTKDFRVLHLSSIFGNRLNRIMNHHTNSISTYYNSNFLGLSTSSGIDNKLVDQKDEKNILSQNINKGNEDFLNNRIGIKKDFLPLFIPIPYKYRYFFQNSKTPQLRSSGSLQKYLLSKDQLQDLLGVDIEKPEKSQKKNQEIHLYGLKRTRFEDHKKKRLIAYKEDENSKQERRHLRLMQFKPESKYQSETFRKRIESTHLRKPLSISTSLNAKTDLPWLQISLLHMLSKQVYRNQSKKSQSAKGKLRYSTHLKKLLDQRIQKAFIFQNHTIEVTDRKKIESIHNPYLYFQQPPTFSPYLPYFKFQKDTYRRKIVSPSLVETKLGKTTLYRVSNIFSRHILFLSQLMYTVRILSFDHNIGICIPGMDSSMSPYLYGFLEDLRWNLSYLIRVYHLKELLFKKKIHELRNAYQKNQNSFSIYSEFTVRSEHPVQTLKSLLFKKNGFFFLNQNKDFNLYKDYLKNIYLNHPHRMKILLISSYQNVLIILKTHLLLFRISSFIVATYYTYIKNIYKQYVGKKKHYSHRLGLRSVSLSDRNHFYLRRYQRSQIVFATIRGLCKGLSRFQLYRKVKFLTYASWWVRQYTSQKSIKIDAKGKYSQSILIPSYMKEWIERFRVKKNTIIIQTGQLVHFWSIDRNQPLPTFKYLALFSYLSYSSSNMISMFQKINNKRFEEEVQNTKNVYGREIIMKNQKQTSEKYIQNPYNRLYVGHYGYYYVYYRALLRVKRNYLTNFHKTEKDFQKKKIYRSGGRSRKRDLGYEKTLYNKALFKSLLQASGQVYNQMVCVPYLSRKDLSLIGLLIGLYPYKEHQVHDLNFLFSITSGSLNNQVFNHQIRRLVNRHIFWNSTI